MAQKVVLLDLLVSPFATKVRIGLAEKGVEYESLEQDLRNKSPLLLEMNPVHQKVPVLIHNGRPVSESSVIPEYIDEVYNKASVFALKTSGEMQEAAKKELVECYKVLEGELDNKPYFGGENFNAIDITLIPFYSWFYLLEKTGLKMTEEYPKIVDWAERCMNGESVSKSIISQEKTYEVRMFFRNEYLKGSC